MSSTEKNEASGSGVLGKRKSCERDSYSVDDGYCTCGSCDSTPKGSTTVGCVCHKVKRKEEETKERQLSPGEDPGLVCYSCGDESGWQEHRSKEAHVKNSNTNVNGILDEFDRIFSSPEALAALKEEEQQSTVDLSLPPSGHRAVPKPSVPHSDIDSSQSVTHTDCQVPSPATEQKPAIELSVGLEEIAQREDEELKKAMEESLKQQVMILIA